MQHIFDLHMESKITLIKGITSDPWLITILWQYIENTNSPSKKFWKWSGLPGSMKIVRQPQWLCGGKNTFILNVQEVVQDTMITLGSSNMRRNIVAPAVPARGPLLAVGWSYKRKRGRSMH